MLYLLHGTDQKKIQEQSNSIVESLRAKREFAQVFHIHADTFDQNTIEGQQNTQGLFFDKHIFVYKNLIAGTKESREFILNKLKEYIASPHLHMIVESEVDDKYLKQIEKHKEIVTKRFNGGVAKPTREDISKKMFNSVALVAELKCQDESARTTPRKISAWKTVDEIRRSGSAPEEFFGILWWKYKTIMQARGVTQKDSGLAPYSYAGAKKVADTYEKIAGSLHGDVSTLLSIYHDAHNGECDMWEALEGWVLA